LLTIVGSAAPADRPAAISAPEARVLELYRLAAEHPDTHVEAVVRSAYVHARSGRAPEALALLDTVPPTPQDQRLLYLHHLIRGQVLVALGRLDEAATAFRTATVVLPAAPSAMVGLMTTTVAAGRETEASALAERVLATDRRMLDPWWVFPLGDYAAYDVIRARLRGLAE
jgi:hypothetical protein